MEDTTRGADDTVNLDNTVDVDPNDVTVDVTKEETESNVKNESTGQSADMSEKADDSSAAPVPTISSYFGQAATDDPFGSISSSEPQDVQPSVPKPGVKLEMPDKGEELVVTEEDERQFSPPVTKEEISSDDLISVHESAVDLSKASQMEVNRMYDAWIPSDTTRRLITQAFTSGGKFTLPSEKSLKPRLAMADTQADPVFQETYKLKGESETQKRQILNLTKVDHTIQGLQQLIRAECWRSALDLTAILLTNMSQGLQSATNITESVITEQSMKVWTVRISLLTKLKMYSIAEAECQQFSHFESAELHFEYHFNKYPNRTGSMVPFSLRLLYACLPQFLGRHNESLDRLFHIRGQVNKILHNLQNGGCEDGGATVITDASRQASVTLWHQRELKVLYSLAACLADMKDFRLSIMIYKEILARDPDNKSFTFSTMGRLCLQMGALKAAEDYFNQSVGACDNEQMKNRLAALHSGYLNICDGNYVQSPEMFSQAASGLQPNAMVKNNTAVSMLYNGQLKAGILLLEELIHSDPVKHLQDTIVTNLCTLYELETTVATSKKQQLLFLANQYKGNGFNINCLKMSL